MKYLLLLCVLLLTSSVSSQEVIYKDQRFDDNIKSVSFAHLTIPLTLPYIDLGSNGKLKLEFDDMEGGFKDYTYEIVHCNKDWAPSDLDEMQYLDGFNGERIIDIRPSTNGYSDYTHYELILPNQDLNWTISGNYALIIKDEDTGEVVMTRRFIVAEKLVELEAEIFNNAKSVDKLITHHELTLKINLKDLHVSRPYQEIFVTAVQNGNWNSSQDNYLPDYSVKDSLFFNQFDRITFPAMREFRNFDIRPIDYTTQYVHSIEKHADETNVLLHLNRPRVNRSYFFEPDANGQFVIGNSRFDENDIEDRKRISVASEYTNVIFTLERDHPYEQDVYITGAFCDWRPSEETRMEYDAYRKLYVATVSLKQGYYDYALALMDENGFLDHSLIEGNRFETENSYEFIVYYREFGALYDRVIGLEVSNVAN